MRHPITLTLMVFAGGLLTGLGIAAPTYTSSPWPQGIITGSIILGITLTTTAIIQLLNTGDDEACEP